MIRLYSIEDNTMNNIKQQQQNNHSWTQYRGNDIADKAILCPALFMVNKKMVQDNIKKIRYKETIYL